MNLPGYTTKSKTVSTTKTIGPVDRNDMSYVPATTVKDGVTLNLSGVDWQIIGTDVVGDSMAPTTYQAVATYSGKTSSKVATGYTATAEYRGNIYHSGVDSITYKVKYLGMDAEEAAEKATEKAAAVQAAEDAGKTRGTGEPDETGERRTPTLPSVSPSTKEAVLTTFSALSRILGATAIAAALVLALLLWRSRKEIRQLQDPDTTADDEEIEEENDE